MKTKGSNFNFIRIAAVFLFLIVVKAQLAAQQDAQINEIQKSKSLFLGVGLGINDYGFGGVLELPVAEKLALFGNIGLGGWGYKIGGGIGFYPSKVPYKSSVSIGYAFASGFDEFETELNVEPNNQSEKVMLRLNHIGTVNLVYSYNIHLGKSSKFVVSAGYAIPLTDNTYDLKSPGVVLTETSKQVIDIMAPGGLILGIRFMFGIN